MRGCARVDCPSRISFVSISLETSEDIVLLHTNMALWAGAKTTTAVMVMAVFVQASFFCGATVPVSLDWYGYST